VSGIAKRLLFPVRQAAHSMWTLQNRERLRLRDEMSETQRLVPLLMKQRNGAKWTDEDKRELRHHLNHLVELAPYLLLFVAPGGFFVLPVLAWWLDRRRGKRE
jgi:hypothetical protein